MIVNDNQISIKCYNIIIISATVSTITSVFHILMAHYIVPPLLSIFSLPHSLLVQFPLQLFALNLICINRYFIIAIIIGVIIVC